jgi:ribokinase
MKKILVAGLINVETDVYIRNFPIAYSPIDYCFDGVNSYVSGVGFNIAKSLKTLGDEPLICSITGNDFYHEMIIKELEHIEIKTDYILPIINKTTQSAILYDSNGNRKIVLDLKNIQEVIYPNDKVLEITDDIDLAIICNINFARPLLKVIKEKVKLIASDVHIIDDLFDSYNKDYMEYSDILFLSNEKIRGNEKSFIRKIADQYKNKIIVIGMGKDGALLYNQDDDNIKHYPSINTRKIVNTVGAGDALFSSFLHYYVKTNDPYLALENAMYYASYKIGESGAANGFVNELQLELIKKTYK